MHDLSWLLDIEGIGKRLDDESADVGVPRVYTHPSGSLFRGDSLLWLRCLPDQLCDVAIIDPPLDLGEASWDKWNEREAYLDWICSCMRQVRRVLRSSGSSFLFGPPEVLADLRHSLTPLFDSSRWLVWHYRNKPSVVLDWCPTHLGILHLRMPGFQLNVDAVREPYNGHTVRYPERSRAGSSGVWKPHPLGSKPRDVLEIPAVGNCSSESTGRVGQKPEELLRRLVLSSSSPGDIILDPFMGSGTSMVAAEQTERRWLGCDLDPEAHEGAIQRIEAVEDHSEMAWVEHDRARYRTRCKSREVEPMKKEPDVLDMLGIKLEE
jgi:site-specific DNA-methyltransferase (adenine-specific)